MNPFRRAETSSQPLFGVVLLRWPATVAFAIVLLLGTVIVTGRAMLRVNATRARASAEARAISAKAEFELSRTLTGAELLAALAGAAPSPATFQNAATEVLAREPGLACLEFAPAGKVTDVAPRPGNERALGFDFTKDPALRNAVQAAVQKRSEVVAGPLRLPGGEPGITALTPLFQRRDGRETFWGLVGASVRLGEALSRARIHELAARGYSYSVLAGTTQGFVVAEEGKLARNQAIQEPIRAGNLELLLLIQPRNGWVEAAPVCLEAIAALAIAALFSFTTRSWSQRREFQTQTKALGEKVVALSKACEQAHKNLSDAREQASAAATQLDAAKLKLKESDQRAARLLERSDQWEQESKGGQELAQASIQELQARAGELELQLDTRVRSALETAQAHQREQEKASQSLRQARQTIAELQNELQAAIEAKDQALISAQQQRAQDQSVISALQNQLTATSAPAAHSIEPAAPENPAAPEAPVISEPAVFDSEPPEPTIAPIASEPSPAPADIETAPPASSVPAPTPAPEPAPQETPTIAQTTPGQLDPAPETKTQAPGPVRRRAPGSAKKNPLDQMDLFGAPAPAVKPHAIEEKEERRSVTPIHPPPPLKLPDFRQALHEIVPLLTDLDPGAKDCFKAHKTTFRSALSPEGYEQFEQSIQQGVYAAALDQLRKGAKRHGITV